MENNEQDKDLNLDSELHPTVHTSSGGVMIFNPGTGKVAGATKANAISNGLALIDELGYEFIQLAVPDDDSLDYGDGRYGMEIADLRDGRHIEIQMPGWELDKVRYRDGLNPFDFPRLYVDGSSWLWTFAVNILSRWANHEDQD